MEKLDICLINDSFPPSIDGVANAVVNYAKIINASLGSATVVAPADPLARDGDFDFPVYRYPSLDTTRLVGYRAGIPFSPKVQGQLAGQGFQLIHSHCPITSTMLARALRAQLDLPLVLTYHTKFDIDIANAISSRLIQEEAKRLLVQNISACDEVWVVSRGAGENLRSLGYEGDYLVMPNGVDLPRGRVDDEQIQEAAGGYDLPEGVPVFLFVGRMMWYKGLRLILDALAKVKAAGRDFRMVFVGGGGDKSQVEDYCRSLGLDDKAIFVPPIHDRELVRAWYCRADLFLFPSTFDTNGLVVREAAACGLASVLIRGSCAAEDVADGVNGFLIEEDAEDLARLLIELCPRRESMAQVGDAAQRDLYISWDSSVRRAYERYGAVIDNYRRGLYPEHEGLSDEFYQAMSSGMARLEEGRRRQRQRAAQLRRDYQELREDIRDELEELRQEHQERIDELRQEHQERIEELRQERQERIEELRQERQERAEEREERRRKLLEELSQYMDRFL